MNDEQHTGQPDGSGQPDHGDWDPWGSGPSDATTPLDLDATQEVDPSGSSTAPVPADASLWARPSTPEPTPAPTPGPMEEAGAAPAWTAYGDPAAAAPMSAPPVSAPPPTGTPYPIPAPSAWAQGGYGPAAGTRAQSRARARGPGWLALVAVTGIAALMAGLGGGVLGGWLVYSGVLTGSRTTNDPRTLPTPGPAATTRPEGTVANIAAKALPSVVTINVVVAAGTSTGSGWVYDDAGHIVTNNHVIADAGTDGKITVILSNGKQASGTVVGSDASYDLAVVKIDRTDLVPLPVGVSADVVVGDPVIAVGAPLGLDSTVTTGIVSALNRPVAPGGGGSQTYINAIQTDAAINPGNSGGPLLDMQGRVIGVNSAIARLPGTDGTTTSGSIGLGFAIPSDQVRKTVDQLIATGKAQHPVIGVLMDLNYSGEGVRIAASGSNGTPSITPGGPADKAGLKPGDIILEFEGRPLTEPDQLVVAVRARSVGDQVVLTVRRDGNDRNVTLTLQAAQ